MKSGNYYVYITTNPSKTVLYTGLTNDLKRRIIEHYKNRGNPKSIAGKFYCYKLIYYEWFTDINAAIHREKEIKNMSRKLKIELISSNNKNWNFLSI